MTGKPLLRRGKMKKLYEFTALLKYSCIVAAESEELARAEIQDYESAWHEIGELVGVVDVDLFDVREADSQDESILNDLAHVVG
jgi:hypothetical protein